MTDVAKIAAGLTEVQREGLIRAPCRSWWGDIPACMPQLNNTALALLRRGLCKPSGQRAWPLTPLGQLVREYLMKEKADGGR